MAVDKKAEAGQIKYVLIEALGRAGIRTAPADVVAQAIRAYLPA
jgi:3-dehydroquinate synthase